MEVQPADFGTNLNMWFQLLGRRWKPLLFVSMVAFVPLGVVVIAIFLVVDLPGTIERLSDPDLVELMTLEDLIEELTPLLVAGAVGTLLQLVASAFVYLAASRIAVCHQADIDTDWRAASRFAAGRLATAFWAGLLVTLGVLVVMGVVTAVAWALISTLGASFLAIFLTTVIVLTTITALIWIGVSLSLYPQSIAMTDHGVVDSLKESIALVQRRWWASLGFFFVTGLIAGAAAQVLILPLLPLFLVGMLVPTVLAVLYGATAVLQGPVTAAVGAAYSIWYVDLRTRRAPVDSSELIR